MGKYIWRCVDRICPGRAVTDVQDQLVSCNENHSHLPKVTETVVELIKDKMKKRAREETTPIPQIYHKALQDVAQYEDRESIVSIMPTFSSMSSSLYRKRHERLPPLPSSIDELNFEAEWSKTFNGEEFMLGSRDGVFMFSTHNNLALIAEAPTLYMDGTFVYFLLPGKT